jgi:malate-CoA ligase subunit alpha
MGHAGAIISTAGDSAAEKAEVMKFYGLTVAASASELGSTIAEVLRRLPGPP